MEFPWWQVVIARSEKQVSDPLSGNVSVAADCIRHAKHL